MTGVSHQGSDPGKYELIQKIQSLQKRLIAKSQELQEHELLLQVTPSSFVRQVLESESRDLYMCPCRSQLRAYERTPTERGREFEQRQ